jgi:BASS family bile acid:Na+ symporter
MRPALVDVVRVLVATYLIVMMLSMGLELGARPAASKQEKHRQRRLLVRALVFNLLVVPLFAVMLTRGLGASGDVAIAFLLLAAAPGGRFAPHLAKVANADLGLSVETTIYLAKLVAFTTPLTAARMLHVHRIELHEAPFIVQLLALQLLPYLAGRQLRKRRPQLAARLNRPLGVTMWSAVVAMLALILFSRSLQGLVAISSDHGWLAVLGFALVAPLFGWLLGGPAVESCRSFAISANARDFALSMLIASLAFPEHNVDLAIVAVWTVLFLFNVALVEIFRHRPAVRDAHPA